MLRRGLIIIVDVKFRLSGPTFLLLQKFCLHCHHPPVDMMFTAQLCCDIPPNLRDSMEEFHLLPGVPDATVLLESLDIAETSEIGKLLISTAKKPPALWTVEP